MKNKILHFGAVRSRALARSLLTTLVAATSIWLAASVQATTPTGPTITTIGGGDPTNPTKGGYSDGSTASASLFHTPSGLALDSSGEFLFIADRDNNLIRYADLTAGQTYTLDIPTNMTPKPIAVALDAYDYIYVLNKGNGTNGSVYTFWWDPVYGLQTFTNATRLTNVCNMALDRSANIYVTLQTNKIIKINAYSSTRTLIATVTNSGALLQGLTVLQTGTNSGNLAVCDSGRNGIYIINPTTGIVSTNIGFRGTGDFQTNAATTAAAVEVKFNQPMCILETGNGVLVVSDYGNNRVKAILPNGYTTNLYGVTSQFWSGSYYPGWLDGPMDRFDANSQAHARQPYGLVLGQDGSLYTSEQYYHLIRKLSGAPLAPPVPYPPGSPTITSVSSNYTSVTLTWSSVSGATNYNVYRSQVSGSSYTLVYATTGASFTDTNVTAGGTYYYVVSASNAGGESAYSSQASATVPFQPAAAPQIGYLTFVTNSDATTVATFNTFSSHIFYNDAAIVITSSDGVNATLRYTYGSTGTAFSWPTTNGSQAQAGYVDGKSSSYALSYALPSLNLPDATMLAVAYKDPALTNTYSALVSARLQFITAPPTVSGNNAAQFWITNATDGAQMYYTIDGSEPTNNMLTTSVGPIYTGTSLSLHIITNTIFKIKAFRANYQPSSTVSALFSPTNYVANSISFGFASGEASSDFVASPGQIFYAPVTLSMLSGVSVYSLQFNITVTNIGTHPVPPGQVSFGSLLRKPIDNIYVVIPTYSFVTYGSNSVPSYDTNVVVYGGNYFQNLTFTNSSANLLGVGWLERFGQTNLYNTKAQDLITYSAAHDVLYPNNTHSGQIEVGGYAFQVPLTATTNDYYQISIGRPSATSDGIGAPGSDVYIDATTNGSLIGSAPINAVKNVTIGQRKYIVGSVYPFRWFNAGDFGSSNIVAADVAQVFESAVYDFNTPFQTSDLYNGMDSCGSIGVLNTDTTSPNYGYYTNSYAASDSNTLFNGDDTSINSIAFGDGVLDICDVFVTYRRALDPSLTWYRRFWNNGFLVADTTANVAAHAVVAKAASSTVTAQAATTTNSAANARVIFQAGDIIGSAGQTIQIPINATILGNYPLRYLMLNLTVNPLDGAPALTSAVSFTTTSTLGTPWTADSKGNGNYSAVWMTNSVASLTGTTTIGYLTVTIPAGAPASAAYAVTFDHASASPNGLASFPSSKLTGLVTLASRTNSCYNDGIPDSWRLRWFGTTNNVLSSSNACPSGDGINNYKKYVAGVDPNTANDFPSVVSKTTPSGYSSAVTWPSVLNKQYVIERSGSLFNGVWSTISTNTGTGGNMEFDDTNAVPVRFYRVRILP